MPDSPHSHTDPSVQTAPAATQSITSAVVAAVTETTGTKPTTPLYEAIDPDALEKLYQHAAPEVSFEYAGQHVTISPDQVITVAEQ